jgi:hypothetical protein
VAIGIIAAIAIVRFVALRHRSAGVVDHRRSRRPDSGDRPDKRVSQYRASGALPRWD